MKNNKIKLIISLFLCAIAYDMGFGREINIKFGKIEAEDLKHSKYELDPEADAIVLGEFGKTYFTFNETKGAFNMVFDRHIRIKILNKNGYSWGDFKIPLYHKSSDKEIVTKLKGFTYTLQNGKIKKTKLTKKSVFDEKISKNWDAVKFSMPNVREGSVIDVTYQIHSDFYLNLQPWHFQKSIPVLWSEYQVEIPEYYNYLQIAHGYEPLTLQEHTTKNSRITLTRKNRENGRNTTFSYGNIDYLTNVYKFAGENMPALKSERFITRPDDFTSQIEFQLASVQFPQRPVEKILSDWPEVEKHLLESENFGRQIRRNNFLQSTLVSLVTESQTESQKLATIYNHIRQHMTWNEKYGYYVDQNIKKAYDDRKGSAAEINLLLVSMLRKAGFNADPVILSTRNHGRIHPIYPIMNKFNYVVAYVKLEKQFMLLDATDQLVPMGLLPERCINMKGRLISENGSKWINLQKASKKQTKMVQANFKINEANNSLKGSINISCEGYNAVRNRRKILSDKGKFLKDYRDANQDWIMTNVTLENVKDLDNSLIHNFEIESEQEIEHAGNILFIDPIIKEAKHENFFTQETRELPVDFLSSFSEIYQINIIIPEGYEIDELPERAAWTLPGRAGAYSYHVLQNDNTITLTTSLSIKKSIFLPNEYQVLKKFFDLLLAHQDQQIVLKKSL